MKKLKDCPLRSNFRDFLLYAINSIFVILVLAAPTLLPSFTYAAEMQDYCLVPPYVKRDVFPNIMILMDVSTDMNGPAYPDAYVPNATIDNYDGYFRPQGCYSYSGKFEEAYKSTSPDISYTYADTCPSSAPFRGNLMNWATMSKFDVLQKVIIGGNAVSKIGNAHTLRSISGTWTDRTYGGCKFKMNNGSFRIEDAVLNGDCPLLLSTPVPIASLQKYQDNVLAAMQNSGGRAPAAENSGNLQTISSGLSILAGKIIAVASNLWDNIHFVSEAEAADCLVDSTSQFNSSATIGTPYSFTMSASPTTGAGNFVWTFSPSPLCSWLADPVISGNKLQTARASGTPTSEGTCTFTVTAKRPNDGSICTAPTAVSRTINISCPVPSINTASISNGQVGVAYSYALTGAGGYNATWSATGLPNGLSIDSSTGLISGTPTICGTFNNVVVTYTDAAPCGAHFASKTFSMSVSSGLQITQPAGTRINAGQTNYPYSYQLLGTGGSGTYTWSVTDNCLDASPPPYDCFPHGLTLNTSTGLISGTPTFGQGLGNDFTFRVTLTDQSTGCPMPYKDVLMLINAAATGLNVNSPCPPSAIKGEAYSFQATGAGGTLPYAWSATGLPAGFSMSASGLITGSSNTQSSNAITIYLTDSVPMTVTQGCTFEVITSTVLNSLRVGVVDVTLIEETFVDLNGNDIYDPGTLETYTDSIQNSKWDGKQGVFQKYWDANNPKARWGMTQFDNSGVSIPSAGCIPASPASAFYTNFQNVQMRNSPLADGLYGDINYYSQGHFDEYVSNTYSGCVGSDPIDAQKCRKNFVLIVTAGADVTSSHFNDETCTSVPNGNNTEALVQNACFGAKTDLRTDKDGSQHVYTYIVNTMGTDNNDILEDAAAAGNGNYYPAASASELSEMLELAFKDILARAASGTAASVLASGEGSGANLIQAVFYPRRKIDNTEIFWIGRLTNLWYYVDPFFGNSTIRLDDGDKILNLLTDASHKDYIAELYYDSTTETTRARRFTDTTGDGAKDAQVAGTDIEFEKASNLWEAGTALWKRSSARAIYTNCSAASTLCIGTSGLMNFSTADSTTRTALRPYLQAADDNEAEAIIRYVHGEDDSFVIGGNTYSYRQRKVKADLNNDGDFDDTVDGTAEGTARVWKLGDVLNSTPKISSWIPLNQFHRTYSDTTYGNGTTGGYINTTDYKNRGMVFTGSNDGVLHAFNLGRLQLSWSADAYDANGQQSTEKARLIPPVSGTSGEEMWAFIPKNVLPYLTYQKENNYCHIYSVDLTPYVFDASINKPAACGAGTNYWDCAKTTDSWRTVLIGGMRYGGACRSTGSTCTDCVKTPIADPADATKSLGYSSYFAIDITDQDDPKLLWEWDGTVLTGGVYENHLGFSTTGPAIVKINSREQYIAVVDGVPVIKSRAVKTNNGRWFAVIGSGPTGPVGTDQQFMGRSDQTARVFIIDVMNGPTAGNFWEVSSGVSSSFIGSMINANDDTDLDYQDDVLYIPYVSLSGTAWNNGGILRLRTNEDLDGSDLSGSTGTTALNPANWTLGTVVSDIGPMTSSVARLQNPRKGQLWLFGGTGRYYYELGPDTDDATTRRQIFGIKDPCFSAAAGNGTTGGFDPACSASISFCADPVNAIPPLTCGGLTNVTNIADVPASPDVAGFNGWYINLDAHGDYTYSENGVDITRPYRAEREITDPLATSSGLVFYTTYKPYGDECSVGGKSFIWATKYDTGGAAGALLKGKALVQVSTGSIEQIDLASAFTAAGGRKSYSMEGVPPTAQGLSVMSTPPPVKRVMHIRER
jgi:hypothetical protein